MPRRAYALTPCLGLAALCCVACIPATGARAVHNILDCGATPDGKTLCTAAIQKAIDAAADGGGGVVRFPKGTFLSGPLRLRSGVTLQLDEGATLLGSRDREHYYGPKLDDDGQPVAGTRVFRNLLHGEGLRDVAIRGKGTIDGQGDAFRDKTKKRTKCIYLAGCRNVLIEGVRMRAAGSWMQHYRLCEGLVIRDIDVFNHVAFNNDGLNVDSCRDVTITRCRVDSDDDGIVLKSLSGTPCRDVTIADCVVSSHCNAIKMGTESGGGFIGVTVSRCKVFSPRQSQKIYGRQRGLAGIALEIVDGGTLEDVTVTDVDIEGVSVPIFLRLGHRARRYGRPEAPGVGTLHRVRIANVTARGTSAIGCSITGLPGHPIEDVTLENLSLGFDGGGTREQAGRAIPEREKSYPESTMFGTLPAWGLYCRHVRGLTFRKLTLSTAQPDLRHALVFDDVQALTLDGFEVASAKGAAPLVRMANVRKATLRGLSPARPADVLLRLEGKDTRGIALRDSDLSRVRRVATFADGAPESALSLQPSQ